jgi:ribosomal-protein-alanine N-acetyltransferase
VNKLPTIETPRLRLRCPRVEDAADYHALETDPVVKQFLRGPSKLSVKNYGDAIAKDSRDGLTVALKDTGAFVGRCGFTYNPFAEGWEIDVVLVRTYHKKGYGLEIGSALIQLGFEVLGLNIIYGVPDAANTASIHLCEKLGMKYIRSLNRNDRLQHVYSIESTPKMP